MGISARIVRQPRFSALRFTRSEMRKITEAARNELVQRFYSGLRPNLSPAAPLKTGYAISKSKRTGRRAIRDWRMKKDLIATTRVTVSNASMGLIKFPADSVRIAQRREQQDSMFDLGPREEKAGTAVAQQFLSKALKRAAK